MEWQKVIEKKNAEITVKDKIIEDKKSTVQSIEQEMETLKDQLQQVFI